MGFTNDVVLDVIGSGWWEDKLRAYAEASGVGERVFFSWASYRRLQARVIGARRSA